MNNDHQVQADDPLIERIRKKRAALEQQLAELKRDEEAAERLALRYGGGSQIDLPEIKVRSGFGVISRNHDFSSKTLRECLMLVLKDQVGPIKARHLAALILSGGYQTNSPDLSGPIFSMLGRMKRDGLVRSPETGLFELIK